jgi:hypothetical protein
LRNVCRVAALPCPALPCPALPCPTLPCHALHSPPLTPRTPLSGFVRRSHCARWRAAGGPHGGPQGSLCGGTWAVGGWGRGRLFMSMWCRIFLCFIVHVTSVPVWQSNPCFSWCARACVCTVPSCLSSDIPAFGPSRVRAYLPAVLPAGLPSCLSACLPACVPARPMTLFVFGSTPQCVNKSIDPALVERVNYPAAGHAIFMQGSKIAHSVTPVKAAREPRLTLVNSCVTTAAIARLARSLLARVFCDF